jgi:hypothetical protein
LETAIKNSAGKKKYGLRNNFNEETAEVTGDVIRYK